jgi:hypothetical protein
MAERKRGEDLMWRRLATFAKRAEYILCTGASLADAEEVLFGWQLAGNLPACFASLTGGMEAIPAARDA